MSEPADFVLGFLRKNGFAKAEAAFKSELVERETVERPDVSPENVMDWDSQLSRFTVQDEENATSTQKEQRSGNIPDKRESKFFPGRVVFPPEKQLFVEYEPVKVEPQIPLGILSSSAESGSEISFRGSSDTNKNMIQQSGNSLTTAKDTSLFEWTFTGGDLSTQVNDEPTKQSSVSDSDGESQPHQPPMDHSSTVPQLPGLENCVEQHDIDKNEAMHINYGMEFTKSGPFEYRDGKQDPATDNQGRLLKPNISGAEIWSIKNEEVTGQPVTECLPAKINSLAPSTSGGYLGAPPIKTCLPPSLFKLSQQEDQLGMLFPYSVDLRNQTNSVGNGDVGKHEIHAPTSGSGVVGHLSIPEKTDPSANGVQEELPRLPPVKLHFIGRCPDPAAQLEGFSNKVEYNLLNGACGWTTLPDGELVEEVSSSGLNQATVRPSVSQGIVEAMSDQLSDFAIPVDTHGERWCGDEYCDSDTYEDDDDPGYLRQPIEDEEWFITHEIDYPSDNERVRQLVEKNAASAFKQSKKITENGRSLIDEESYFLGEECYNPQVTKDAHQKLHNSEFGHIQLVSYNNDNDSSTHSDRINETAESCFVGSKSSWKGFMGQLNNIKQTDAIFSNENFLDGPVDEFGNYNNGSVKSGGIQANSDAADVGSEVRDSVLGGSSEADLDIVGKQELSLYDSVPTTIMTESQRHQENKESVKEVEEDEDEQDMILQYYDEAWGYSKRSSAFKNPDIEQGSSSKKLSTNKNSIDSIDKVTPPNDGFVFEGFSFPSPSSTGDIAVSTAGSGKSIWSNRESPAHGEDIDLYGNSILGPDNTLAAWKRKSDNSSPVICSSEEGARNPNMTHPFPNTPYWTKYYASLEARERGLELDPAVESPIDFKPSTQEEGDTSAALEERTVGADEDQFEIFNLRIIHRKNRTGFEEEKDFPVLINSVIAGRYHVTEYLGSAAFSKAIQAHDLHTGMDVCMKIIKNNKDFFDQSLDEIKLLKFVNKHDPADKYHVLRLYDYFYHREHLFIVCELLRANLYEFQKFNRESGGEVYFTMPRLQSITRQCLEALEFLHGLGIIHCDLKPENILVKSYSRCEIKIIDLGSSCFQTDHLCSYVQSRSYRAPEVILGLPYDQKIDIWSLGCILAELCTGNVLFQNDSLATLLARVVGILGPIDPDVLAKGRDSHKYFTKNHMLYERNQETDRLEYLLPKKTSLRHRVPMGDKGFVEFVRYLLQSDPAKRPTAAEALRHPWLSFPYEPISC